MGTENTLALPPTRPLANPHVLWRQRSDMDVATRQRLAQ
jgi:hypothetical protein